MSAVRHDDDGTLQRAEPEPEAVRPSSPAHEGEIRETERSPSPYPAKEVETLSPRNVSSSAELLSDEELMDRYCAGDPEAFNVLFSRYRERIVRFLSRMVGPAQAVDLGQVTFLKLHENRHRYRVGGSFSGWLYTIARNTALDHLRSAAHRREVVGDTERPVDSSLRDGLQDDQVRSAIEGLPKDQRQVVMLHWYGGLTFEEVGEAVGASGAAVRVRAHRAYEKLRTALSGLKKEIAS